MVDFSIEDLAMIFEPRKDEEGRLIYVPTQVVEGFYDDDTGRFVDSNLYSYPHLTDGEISRGFALRNPINELSLNYPDKSLEEIKNILLTEYDKYKYFLSYYKDVVFMFRYEDDPNDAIAIIDEETKTNIFLLFNDEEIQKLMVSKYEELVQEEAKEQLANFSKREVTESEQKININPHLLFKKIRKIVKGQDNAIKEVVTTIWKNYNNDYAKNMILVGSSGTGKTEILRQLSKELDIPLMIIGVTGMSQAGYKGIGTDEILANLISLTKGDIKKAEHAIVVLDEIDKLAYDSVESGKVSTDGVQNELLKIVEDGNFSVDITRNGFTSKEIINTANITFIGVGAFNGMLTTKTEKHIGFGKDVTVKEIKKEKIVPEDLIKFGLKPELVGRMGKIIKLNDLDLDTMKEIIRNSDKSDYKKEINFITTRGIKIDTKLEEEIVEEIAKIAMSKKIGARAINSIVTEMFTDILFDISDPEEEYSELLISKETVTDSKKYVLRK